MPVAIADGIETRYELIGSGPPLLMYSPGGFDAVVEKWRTQGVYAEIQFLDHLSKRYTCVVFDRRETGASGGRVERIGWSHYAAQGLGLADHLGLGSFHLMGGCMGCSTAIALAVQRPERVRSLVLFWPVGGARYRLGAHQRFAEHLAYVTQNGLPAVVELARSSTKAFGADPRAGPWTSVIRNTSAFAEDYAALDLDRYRALVDGIAQTLVDRDTAPGAEPSDLMQLRIPTLVVPGADASHATSAARYLAECIEDADYWDLPVSAQPPLAAGRVLEFLDGADKRST